MSDGDEAVGSDLAPDWLELPDELNNPQQSPSFIDPALTFPTSQHGLDPLGSGLTPPFGLPDLTTQASPTDPFNLAEFGRFAHSQPSLSSQQYTGSMYGDFPDVLDLPPSLPIPDATLPRHGGDDASVTQTVSPLDITSTTAPERTFIPLPPALEITFAPFDDTSGLTQDFADMTALLSASSPTTTSRRKRSPETTEPSKRRSVVGVASQPSGMEQNLEQSSASTPTSSSLSLTTEGLDHPARAPGSSTVAEKESSLKTEPAPSETSFESTVPSRGGRGRGRGRGRGQGARTSHNQVERDYRDRLKLKFAALLDVIPDTLVSHGGADGAASRDPNARPFGKAEVLEMARSYIKDLEDQKTRLKEQRDRLAVDIRLLRDLTASSSNRGEAEI